MNQETEVLLRSLDQQRNHVLGILEGLSDEQLRRPVVPSGFGGPRSRTSGSPCSTWSRRLPATPDTLTWPENSSTGVSGSLC